MKNNRPTRRISLLFARYYLAFTLVLIALFFGFYHLWDRLYVDLLHIPDPDALFQSREFRNGEYADIDTRRYLGPSGGFAVLDAQGQLLYVSTSRIPAIQTPDELLCVADFDAGDTVSAVPFEAQDGQQCWIVIRDLMLEDDLTQTEVMILDEDLRVLDGTSLIPGKIDYTQRELELLTNRWSSQYTLYRKSAQDSSGAPVTVLILLSSYSDADFQAAFDKAGRLWLLTIPLYCGVTLLFIVLLNRHFRRPLTQLGDAIRRLGAGEPVSAAACGGPEEIQELGRSFDAMARQLAESQAETRRLEEQRIKMLTDLSHDLKTPITVISGYISAVRDGKVSEEDLPQYLEIIGKKADALTELINSFYEYSKTEHPDFRLEPVETDLCEFLREYLAKRYDEINLAGFALRISIPEKMILCAIDQPMMTRALNNIIYNAMQYNALGTVMGIKIVETEERNKPNTIAIRLADNGVGIAPERRARIFEPFVTGTDSRSSEGSGLGLAITKKIIEAHGGTITLLDKPSPGFSTEFEILLPAVL